MAALTKTQVRRFSSFIRNRRLKLRLTQVQMAEKCGLDYKHYQSMESLKFMDGVLLATLRGLAKGMRVKTYQLVRVIFGE